ncbi:anti-anti-sigma factor [Kutzneria buriramensis]|uniref:Anti-anti-sigma factor n=1 Tax=Kutzneria buriramensis TaxID=1045776 RepID=A0A3E0HI04_9PSEU|nr:anti-anti-sigma factor [Kutzneria buriramensis]
MDPFQADDVRAEIGRDPASGEQEPRAVPNTAGAAQLRALLAGLNAIVWEQDPTTLRFRLVNQRTEDLLGYPVAQWLAEDGLWQRILHPQDRDEAVRVVTEARGDLTLTYRVRAESGRWVWLRHLVHVTRDGEGPAMHSVLIDVSEQRRQQRASALLAAAGRALSEPGTVEQRLTAVAELAVSEICDRANVWLRGTDGRYRPVAVAPADVAQQVLDLGAIAAPPRLEEVYRTGEPFVLPEITDDLVEDATAGDPARHAAVTALGTRSVLVAPLVAAGQLVGLLTLVTTGDDRHYEDDELALARDLGQRIATMVSAERLAQRQRHLHEITVALAAAGTVAEAAEVLADGTARALGASAVGVCRLGSDGWLHLVYSKGVERVDRFARVRPDAAFPFAEAANTGRPVWLAGRDEWARRYPDSVDSLRPDTEATVSLPLAVAGRVVGALSASFTERRLFEEEERAFLSALATQAAAAFERAALADVRRETAETLQRSLLPGRLPTVDRLAVTVRYVPAVEGTQAGGDWFDVLELEDGQVAVAVGDVVGNGSAAAAVMGQLRSALASLLLAGHSPGRALDLLDRFAAQVAGAEVTTVACLRLEPATGRLVYSRAGHPPMLLAGLDGAGFLDEGLGPALTLPSGSRPEVTTNLPVGATLLLYTDGLVERRDALLDEGLNRLAAVAAPCRALPLPALVDRVLNELGHHDGAGDDIALVAVRILPAPLHTDLPAQPHQLAALRRQVAEWTAGIGLGGDELDDLQLALGEATGNAVEHAYRTSDRPGRVQVTLSADRDGGLRITVADQGVWQPPPLDPGFRGRGVQIIKALADEVDIDVGSAGTVVRFRLPPASTVPPPTDAVDRHPDAREPDAAVRSHDAGGRHWVEVAGVLDLAGVAAVRRTLLDELAGDRPIVLDFRCVRWLASVGVGLLLEAVRTARGHGEVDVRLPSDGPARRLLDLTGLTRVVVDDRRE